MNEIQKVLDEHKKGPANAGNNNKKPGEKKGKTPPKNKSKIAQKEKAAQKTDLSKAMSSKAHKQN